MRRLEAIAILCCACPPALLAQTPIFRSRLDYSVREAPSIAFADFNLDGKMDMVAGQGVVGASVERVCVWSGQGDGTFTQTYCTPALGSMYTVAAADFDGDGKPDVLALEGTLDFLHGNGDGALAPPVTASTVSGFAMAVGDLNGDGKLDVVIVGESGVAVLFGDGTGGFGSPTWYLTGTPTYGVTIGDLNGDGKPDLVISPQSGIVMLLNTGSGQFTPGPTASFSASTMLLADVNADGKLDLISAYGTLPTVQVALGRGDGSFSAPVSYPAQSQYSGVYAVAVGDVNGDGKLDLVAAGTGNQNMSVLFGRGDGTFSPPAYYAAAERATFVATAPLRKPGLLDVVVSSDEGGSLSVMLNTGHGVFFENPTVPSPIQLNQVIAADFNRDGKDDLAVVTNTSLVVLLGTGVRSLPFVAAASIAFPSTAPFWVVSGDFNNDGKLDLAACLGSNSVAVMLGNGNGTFQSPLYSAAGKNISAMAAGDLNRDGNLDLVSGFGYTLFGKGDGTFYPPVTWGNTMAFTQQVMAVADVNGDGNPDVIGFPDFLAPIKISPFNIVVLLGNGKGSFSAIKVNPIPTSTNKQLSLVDVNGDGKPDAIVALDKSVVSLLGNADGTFTQVWQSQDMFAQFAQVVTGDFDGDGRTDIAVADNGNNTIWIFTGNGDGTFNTPTFGYGVNLGAYFLVAGRFQGQGPLGKPDLATTPTINGMDMLFQWQP